MSEAFDELASKPYVGPTNASKILSALKPELFLMGDHPVAEAYGFVPNKPGYSRFLHLMSPFARRLGQVWGERKPALEQYLCPEGRKWHPPLAKLMDEWNWWRITRLTAKK